MTNAITEAQSIEQVVEIINSNEASEFGGSDTREPEIMAGQYAWESVKVVGYKDDLSIKAHLNILYEAGANFDFNLAFDNAVSRKKAARAARTLAEYIDEEFGGSQRAFALTQGVAPAQVTQWLRKEFIVIDDGLYSLRRDLHRRR